MQLVFYCAAKFWRMHAHLFDSVTERQSKRRNSAECKILGDRGVLIDEWSKFPRPVSLVLTNCLWTWLRDLELAMIPRSTERIVFLVSNHFTAVGDSESGSGDDPSSSLGPFCAFPSLPSETDLSPCIPIVTHQGPAPARQQGNGRYQTRLPVQCCPLVLGVNMQTSA